jgi:cobalt-precorrin 5A hydrolase/precorrin-3B C17-methyltransferase
MTPGTVVFAGAGPGAVDLLTLRCRDAIADADVIVYAGSLVNPEVLRFARDEAELHDSARMNLNETTDVLVTACRAGRRVLRLHTGDPALYGAIAEQVECLNEAGVPYEVIPGVGAFSAAAAAIGRELTLPGASQTVILTRRAGRTPVPEGQDIPSLASHRATMALYLSVADMNGLVEDLKTGGYDISTPVAVVHRASWADEQVLLGTLGDIAGKVEAAGIRRQALILVGEALRGQGEASRLYAPEFAHGFRNAIADAPFVGRVAVHALTEAGCRLARHLGDATGGDVFVSEKHPDPRAVSFDPTALQAHLREQWSRYDAHVLIMATGIAVRKTAALLRDKTTDPALVVCDERGRFAIPLAGGHIGGANRLSRRLAAATGGTAVITTATDVQGVPAIDELAALQGWTIVNRDAVKQVNSVLLQRRPIAYFGPEAPIRKGYGDAYPVLAVAPGALVPEEAAAVVAVDCDVALAGVPLLKLSSRRLVVGIGCRRGTAADEIGAAVADVMGRHALDMTRLACVASASVKADEAGLTAFADARGLPVRLFEAEALADVTVPSPSPMPAKHVGTPSVAEAAALLASRGRLLVPKQVHGNVTVAVACCGDGKPAARERPDGSDAADAPGRIYAVGIGSGDAAGITPRARAVLERADVIVGYKVYCEQVREVVPGKRMVSSGMRQEVARCRAAIDEARAGHAVAVVCSGDAGVYGMAGLLLELLTEPGAPGIDVEVVPGLTAALTAAAALGAPLMNDFSVISLSDLLTARDTILRRLQAVAAAGMPCVLYNPRSRKRTELLNEALRLFSDAQGSNLACGYVRNAGRRDESQWVGRIAELPVEQIDMFTTVILGGRDTEIINGRLVTRRGYGKRHQSLNR